MRVAGIAAICLSLWAGGAGALDVEDRQVIAGAGDVTLRILSTADLDVFAPYLDAFHAAFPEVTLDYTVASSSDVNAAIAGGAAFDLAISSAMDLQFQLANDGFAQDHRSAMTDALPDWALWRDQIFAFSVEPAVVVVSTDALGDLPLPETRQELIALLRDNPERFEGRVGTYDVRTSGLGYLFATQEARATDAYWRLSEVMGRLEPRLYCCSGSEVMGRLEPRLYCCSGEMIDDVATGRLALAYNVLGSYAAERLARASDGRIRSLRMRDFSNAILRTVVIPARAAAPEAAGDFVDLLLEIGLREEPGDWPLPPLGASERTEGAIGPIRLGPALMVYLDALNRRAFLEEWVNAIEQR